MSNTEDWNELALMAQEIQDIIVKKIQTFLMGKSKEDKYRIVRRDIAPLTLDSLGHWALENENYEINQAVIDVKNDNLDEFKVGFNLAGEEIKALLIKFKYTDDIIYYHADLLLPDKSWDLILNLHKRPDGTWFSDWQNPNPAYFEPLGKAIDYYELSR